MGHGMPTARLAQVRVTQNLGSGWSVAGLIGNPNNAATPNGITYTVPNNGQAAETPQIQAKVMYEQDLWGKAAYYGVPKPFTARLIAGWQRNVARPNAAAATTALSTFGNNAFGAVNASFGNHQYLNPWMIMGNVFIPVLPTASANLAGTASLSLQAYLGQAVGAFGENMGNDFYGQFAGAAANGRALLQTYSVRPYQRYGGYVQGQYYFTNHWFTNVSWGMSKIYGVSQARNVAAVTGANPLGSEWAGADQPNFWQEIDFTLWYRPITAIKFGLQYAWQQTNWMQVLSTGVNGANTSNTGTAHRVEFVGFFYF
jgi:hypothetical protein